MEYVAIFTGMANLLKMTMIGCLGYGAVTIYNQSKNKAATSFLGKNIGPLNGNIGFKISKKYTLRQDKCYEGVAIFGPPGEGKSTSFFLNNLYDENLMKSSRIIADVKGELWTMTHKYRESLNEKCILFEPLGTNARYNPLEFANDFTEVSDLAMSILKNALKNDFDKWSNMAMPLLTAALLYVKTLPKQYANISHAVKILNDNKVDELADIFLGSMNQDVIEQFNLFLSGIDSPATIGSIKISLLTKLRLFLDPKIVRVLSHSDFTPQQLRDGLVNIYVKYDVNKSDYLSPVLCTFYSQMLDKLMEYDRPGTLPIMCLIDEMQNMGYIPKLQIVANTCRSYRIALICCCQNLTSLYEIYGKNNTITILNALKCKLVLPSISDTELLMYVSDLTGFTEVPKYEGKEIHQVKKKLFEHDEVRRIETGEVLIIAHNIQPTIDNLDYWFKNPECIKNSKTA